MQYEYDIRGNVLSITDALGRIVFRNGYDLANQVLYVNHLDAGEKYSVMDAAGKPIYMYDTGKGSAVYNNYDTISRPLKSYARDYTAESFTMRSYVVYGDHSTQGPADPADTNHLGKPYKSYDESGLVTILEYDFKGNPLSKVQKVVNDDTLMEVINSGSVTSWEITPYRTDWTETPWTWEGILEGNYQTDIEYDALNRAVQMILPEDVDENRKVLTPTYNRAGVAEKIDFDGTEYIKLMAYDAKGQLSLAAFDNEIMTRYAYDPLTFRLKRVRSERYEYTLTGNEHEYDYLSGNVRQDLVYDYDLVGNILKQTNLAPDSGIDGSADGVDKLVRLFTYDPLYRLLKATGREANTNPSSNPWFDSTTIGVSGNANNCRVYREEYDYDKAGRITRLRHTASTNNYTRKYNYATGNNMLEEITDGASVPNTLASFTYDANGNQILANSERHKEYDAGDMMRSYYNQTGSSEYTVYAQYLYSGGARVKKLVRTADDEYTSTVYIDGVFEYHKKVTTSTTEEKNYTQLDGGIEIRTGSFTGDITDTVTYSLADHLSSITTRLNADRDIIDKEEYYPYGETSMRTTELKRYRYTGKEKDAESGLYYYGARYYAPWTLCFLSVDPAASSTHYQSSYNYADCNPIVMNDPTGMQSEMNGDGINAKDTEGNSDSGSESLDGGIDVYINLDEVVITAARIHKQYPSLNNNDYSHFDLPKNNGVNGPWTSNSNANNLTLDSDGIRALSEYHYWELRRRYDNSSPTNDEIFSYVSDLGLGNEFVGPIQSIAYTQTWIEGRSGSVGRYFEGMLSDSNCLSISQVVALQDARIDAIEAIQVEYMLSLAPPAVMWMTMYETPMVGRIAGGALTRANRFPRVKGTPKPSTVGFGSGDSRIIPYRDAQKTTKGKGGEIQGHHIIEDRHLKLWGLSSSAAPAIVLTRFEHTIITNTLLRLLPKGRQYTQAEVMSAYRIAYRDFPTWLKAAENFLN